MDKEVAHTMSLLPDFDFAQPVEVCARMTRFIQVLAAAGLRTMEDPYLDVRDTTIPSGAPIRIYTPRHGRKPFAAIVYFHGGAFVLGDLESNIRVAWRWLGILRPWLSRWTTGLHPNILSRSLLKIAGQHFSGFAGAAISKSILSESRSRGRVPAVRWLQPFA